MGWYYMSLLEVIQLLPPSHPGVGKLKGYFVSLTQGLKDSQDETGGWWNVMEKRYEDVEGNYIESSAGAMFTFGLLRGLRLGYISKKDYLATTIKAWKKGLVDKFITYNQDGTINFEGTVEVGSLGSNATFEVSSSSGGMCVDRSGGFADSVQVLCQHQDGDHENRRGDTQG